MAVHDHPRTEPTPHRPKPSDGQPSQRDLVALSLLLCPR